MTDVAWPKGKKSEAWRKRVAKIDVSGRVLAIDQCTGADKSMPGYALYVGGVLKEAGVIDVQRSSQTSKRLEDIYTCLRAEFQDIDVLAVEHLRGGKVSNSTHWSTGIVVTAIQAKKVIEVPIQMWKALAKIDTEYAKADDADAIKIGAVLMALGKHK